VVRFVAILFLIAAVGGGIYYLLSMERIEDVKVTGKLQVSQQIGTFVKTSQVSDGSYYAVVEGKVKNNLHKPIKNIFIKYSIAGQETSATIFDLGPGQELTFNTRGVNTDISKPEFDFVGVLYD